MDDSEDMDWADDPQQLAEITAAAGLHGNLRSEPPASAQSSAPYSRAEKIPCQGSVPVKEAAPEATPPVTPVDDRLNKLGEVTLVGFEKINNRLLSIERERDPTSWNSLQKGCTALVVGYFVIMVGTTIMAVAMHLLGITK